MILLGWASRHVEIVLENVQAWRMFDRARRFHIGEGGRFEIRRGRTVVLWSAGSPSRPVGALTVAWRDPDRDHATVRTIAWDEVVGSEDEVRQALELLTAGEG